MKCPNIDVDRCTNNGQTAQYWACVMGNVDIIKVLIDHKADVNKADPNGISPLHIACMACDKKAVKLLINHGADKNLRDKDGDTRVDIAYTEKYQRGRRFY